MSPEKYVLNSLSGGFFEVTDERIDELMIEKGKVDSSRGLQKHLQIAAIQRFPPLHKRIVHSQHWLKHHNLLVESLSESKKRSDVYDPQTEADANHTEFANRKQYLPQISHHHVFVVEDYQQHPHRYSCNLT